MKKITIILLVLATIVGGASAETLGDVENACPCEDLPDGFTVIDYANTVSDAYNYFIAEGSQSEDIAVDQTSMQYWEIVFDVNQADQVYLVKNWQEEMGCLTEDERRAFLMAAGLAGVLSAGLLWGAILRNI